MIKWFVSLLPILLVSCNQTKKNDYTYFGGKIINPKDKYVYFGNENGITDTIVIKEDNTFTGKFKDLKEGLYYFSHGPEFQYLFLEPNDSLLIRLNTWDFDESIVFSGKNCERNNVLISTFLQNEADERVFSRFYGLNYKNFSKKIDSLKTVKQAFFSKYKTEHNETSESFLKILEIATQFPVFRKIETYALNNTKKLQPEELSDTIYNYRKNLNLKSDELLFFPPYKSIVISQIYNDTYRKKLKEFSDEFDAELLSNVNDKITSKKEKNRLLKKLTLWNFYRNSNGKFGEKTLIKFFELSTEENDKEEIKQLLSDVKRLKIGNKIPDFKFITLNGLTKDSKKTLENGNTVFYFRNPNKSSDQWIGSRINYLKRKYSNVNFYVININYDNKNPIKTLDINDQYYLPKNSDAHKFLTSKVSRIILVNHNGIIENCFGRLSSKRIENQIASLQKKK